MSSSAPRRVALFTHRHAEQTREAVRRLVDELAGDGVEIHVTSQEADKQGLSSGDGVIVGDDPAGSADVAVVLGGDGTILAALREFAGRDVPVFSVNYGAIGFLATVDRHELDEAIRRIRAGDWETLRMPALEIGVDGESQLGVNDISFHRRPRDRVAELAYSVGGEQLGRVRCDGLVASTPVGSTGYNLANGGPVLAWGVDGYVVSFIAPHTLTARALVVAPDSVLTVENLSPQYPVDVTTDGAVVCALEPGGTTDISFRHEAVLLAQRSGATFYHRLREKFGRLAY